MLDLKFSRMEWWGNQNKDGLGHMCVGFTDNGDIYLTLDIRKTGDNLFPVFSKYCQVGGKYGHTKLAYKQYRHLFTTLEGYSIKEIDDCKYGILYNDKTFNFKK